MPEDPVERVQVFLSETRVNPLALLLDLTSLLPDSLLPQALWFARQSSDSALRAFVIHALAKRLPGRAERIELTNKYPVPAGVTIDEVRIPEGKEAKRLIAKLSEQQRYEVFAQLLGMAEGGTRAVEKKEVERKYDDRDRATPDGPFRFRHPRSGRPSATKSVEDEDGGAAAPDPPDNVGGEWSFGGGSAAADAGYESLDDDFGTGEDGGLEAADDGLEAADDGLEAADDGFEAIEDGLEGRPAPPPPQPSPAMPESEPQDIVNLGFSHKDAADNTVKPREPLQTGHSYYFWLNIGRKHKDAIGEATRIKLQELPEEAVLTVALFGFDKELVITPDADIGELQIQKNGSVKVIRQPGDKESFPLSAEAPAHYLEDFLLFPITVPDSEATHRLRCNIYCGQVLVQSYVVSAHVKATNDPVSEACSKKLDYVLSESLRASHLNSMTKEPHLLSLMMNDNGDGTHGFRFFGDDGAERFKDDAQIDGQQLAGFLREARAALRLVSWGTEEEWDRNTGSYRYLKETFDEKKLAKDLAYLARAGWTIYSGLLLHLKARPAALEALLANSGLIQIALKLSPRAVLPAAVVYDYPWEPNLFKFSATEFKLCPSFSKALNEARNGGPPLEDCICFHGGCELKKLIEEARNNDTTVDPIICPSGFWGYRHLLGLPLTLDGANTDIPPVIQYKDSLQMFACVSTDPGFTERDPHLQRLKNLAGLKFERDDRYAPFVTRLRKSDVPQLLYFYCHGGTIAGSNNPFLQVGDENDRTDEINPANWLAKRIEWSGPNPLVFINGCHTTSLNPEVTLDFVSSFVQISGAAGVIGTEITIFEQLAVKFAEECFKRFIGAAPFNEPMPIGKAVRGARLELLRQGNPLGLVYIPYAVASLRLEEKK